MKYYLIGEDISKTEISKAEAESYVQEDDYRVIGVPEKNENPCKVPSCNEQAKEPDWVPFEFPEKPGYRLSGIRIVRSDRSGEFTSHEVDRIPADAVKDSTPNTWYREYGKGYDYFVAYPVYEIIRKEAFGGCFGCARFSCQRRETGIKCRNYKEEKK